MDILDLGWLEILPPTAKELNNYPKNLYDGESFFKMLSCCKATHLDVMTFSAHRSCPLSLSVRRLILSVGTYPADFVRRLDAIHTKLYIPFNNGGPQAAYIGSANLSVPTYHELMVKLNSDQTQFAVRYFEHMWRAAKPKHKTN